MRAHHYMGSPAGTDSRRRSCQTGLLLRSPNVWARELACDKRVESHQEPGGWNVVCPPLQAYADRLTGWLEITHFSTKATYIRMDSRVDTLVYLRALLMETQLEFP